MRICRNLQPLPLIGLLRSTLRFVSKSGAYQNKAGMRDRCTPIICCSRSQLRVAQLGDQHFCHSPMRCRRPKTEKGQNTPSFSWEFISEPELQIDRGVTLHSTHSTPHSLHSTRDAQQETEQHNDDYTRFSPLVRTRP